MSAVETLKKPGDWEIRIDTQEDARRFSRLGAYAGFTYAVLTSFAATAYLPMLLKSVFGITLASEETILIVSGLRFAVFWLLAWRTHSGKSTIAAVTLFTLYCIEQAFAVYMIFKSGMFAAVLVPILMGIFGYVLYAGIRGNWANKEFRRDSTDV